MALFSQLDRYTRLHLLIRRAATGSAPEPATKLGISERQVYNYLQELRDMGLPIAYDNFRATYHYTRSVRFEFIIEIQPLTDTELKEINGGSPPPPEGGVLTAYFAINSNSKQWERELLEWPIGNICEHKELFLPLQFYFSGAA